MIVSEDAVVYTPNGIKRIMELDENSSVLCLDNNFYKLSGISRFFAENLVNIKLNNVPSILISPDDKILVATVKERVKNNKTEFYINSCEFKPVSDLNKTDIIVMHKLQFSTPINSYNNWLIGKLCGKSFVQKNQIVILNSKAKLSEYKEKNTDNFKISSGVNENYKNIYLQGEIDKYLKFVCQANKTELPSDYFYNKEWDISFINSVFYENYSKNKKNELMTTSKKFAYQFYQILLNQFDVCPIMEEVHTLSAKKKYYKIIYDRKTKKAISYKSFIFQRIESIAYTSKPKVRFFKIKCEKPVIVNNIYLK